MCESRALALATGGMDDRHVFALVLALIRSSRCARTLPGPVARGNAEHFSSDMGEAGKTAEVSTEQMRQILS